VSAAWPLEAVDGDDAALPPPWDGDIDFADRPTESAVLALQYREPMLALRICRRAFCRAEARGDEQAAVHALYLACVNLFNSSQRALAEKVFAVVRQRAPGIRDPQLSVRIELAEANRLSEQGEHAQVMVIRQRALDSARALGDGRLIFLALTCLAVSATQAGESSLALKLCEEQAPLLEDQDLAIDLLRGYRTSQMAEAWEQIGRAHEAAGERIAARAAWQRARELAVAASAEANNDREALHDLQLLVQILLQLNELGQARSELERCIAGLAAAPAVGSELWCILELARARVEVHAGTAGAQTLAALRAIEASVERAASDVQLLVGDVRQLLLQAQQQSGQSEQALASHKRLTAWHDERQSARSRQRLKMLRHTVLAMRAEAVEFITHDLLTPLAAARTWSQALPTARLPAQAASHLRAAQGQLATAAMLSDQYLGSLRAELMPSTAFEALDLGALADDACEQIVPASPSGVHLMRNIEIGTPVLGDATLLMKALTALLADALDRAPSGTRVELSLVHDSAQRKAVLSIGHDGDGPTMASRTRIYQHALDEDLFAGSELVLALASKVFRLHRMRLRFDASQGRGKRLVLTARTVAYGPATRANDAMAQPEVDVPKETTR
jgi:signal transduction histidine kinase